MEPAARTNGALPSIGQMDSSSLKREEAEIQAAQTMVDINPQSAQTGATPYSGPSPSYSYATSSAAMSSAPASATTLKTSDSHRSSQTEYDIHSNSAPLKQSLPSINEALARRDEERNHLRPRSPDPRYGAYRRHSSPSPGRCVRHSYNSDSKSDHTSQRNLRYGSHWQSPPTPPRSYGPVAPAPAPPPHSPSPRTTQEQWAPPLVRMSQAPHSANAPAYSNSSPRENAQYGPPAQSPQFAGQQYVYSHHVPPATTYAPSQSQSQYAPAYPTAPPPTSNLAPNRKPPPWPNEDSRKATNTKLDHRDSHPSLKHARDQYDLDGFLNEVHECSHNLTQFSQAYRILSHQNQRSAPLSGSTPSIADVHQAMKFSARIQEILDYVLQQVRAREDERVAQERLALEAMERRRARPEPAEEPPANRKETGEGGFANADTKKRRGRAAPPGRCHACNRAETPEWRRGPDGARTLCNACGLHYAKHARKMGASSKAALAGSNLRPKSAGGPSEQCSSDVRNL